MSNNASLSAAKRRRGGGPPPMSPQTSVAGGGNLPPGLPPNFRQLPLPVQQQILRQIQQRGCSTRVALKGVGWSPDGPSLCPRFGRVSHFSTGREMVRWKALAA